MHTRFEALWVPVAGEAAVAEDAASAGETAGEAECRALAERIEAEVRRLEAVFNRHDPASPVAALNRCRSLACADGKGVAADSRSSGEAAGSGRVRAKVADDDLWFLLEIGEQFRKATFGYFDLAALSYREALLQATSLGNGHPSAEEDFPAATGYHRAAEAPFRLLHATHEIELRRGCILDFGGIAKGYALEKVRNILQEAGVENALLNFGGSSVLGMGHHPLGPCWEVAPEGPPPSAPSLNTAQNRDGTPKNNALSLNTPQFRDGTPENTEPFPETTQNRNRTPETAEPFLETAQFRNRTPVFRLRDSALSVSGRDREGRDHIVDPHTGRPASTSASTGHPAPQAAHPATASAIRTQASARIAVTGRSALVCEILSTALYAAPKELQNEIIANFEGYTTLAP